MRGILATLLVAMAVFLAAGCGGSSNDTAESAATTDTAVTETTPTTETTSSGDTTSSDDTTTSDTDTSVAGLSEGCQELADMSEEFAKALGAAGAGGPDADMESTAKAYEAFAEQAPEEIRDAFKTVAAAFAQYADALEGIDLSSGETPDPATIAKLAQAAQSLDDEGLTEANAQISTWVSENCTTGG